MLGMVNGLDSESDGGLEGSLSTCDTDSAKDSPTKCQLKQEMGERQLDSKLLNVRNCSMMI